MGKEGENGVEGDSLSIARVTLFEKLEDLGLKL